MKTVLGLITAALVSAVTPSIWSYTLPSYSYEDMFKQSDLVVIARPVTSRDTGERQLDRHVNPPVPVVSVTTECDALYVLKGPKREKFKLHHFRDLTDPKRVVVGGPTGISFDLHKNKRYLMFLVREPNGSFAPFAGQTDVVDISIQEIVGTSTD